MWIRLGIALCLLGAILFAWPARGAETPYSDQNDGARYFSGVESPESLRRDSRFTLLADLPRVDSNSSLEVERLPRIEDAGVPRKDAPTTDLAIEGFAEDYPASRMQGAWFRSDYLLWWLRGFEVPPLVTSSPAGTPPSQIGVIGAPNTQILYGDDVYHGDFRTGAYLRAGIWFDPCARHGLEGDWLAVVDSDDSFREQSDEVTILARPFRNALTGENAARALSGRTLAVSTSSAFSGAGIRYLHCCWSYEKPGNGDPFHPTTARRGSLDFLWGYRFFELRERLGINEGLIPNGSSESSVFGIEDRFHTTNRFHGSEIGLRSEHQFGRLSVELLGKVGLGNTTQRIFTDGRTVYTINEVPQSYNGGFLAQRTNMGSYTQDHLSLVTELGCTVGWAINRNVRVHFGYTFLFWGNVVRPGNQIDMLVNPNLFPPETVPFSGPLRPAFDSRETEFWAQGMHLGVDCRW